LKIQVQVKLKSKQESIEVFEDHLVVRVKAPPVDGKANIRIIEMLAKHFSVSKSQVTLISGAKSKLKTFNID
jgi:uncharacterized protein (TIGR00251 family)